MLILDHWFLDNRSSSRLHRKAQSCRSQESSEKEPDDSCIRLDHTAAVYNVRRLTLKILVGVAGAIIFVITDAEVFQMASSVFIVATRSCFNGNCESLKAECE
jgi:hypothetical protein